MAGCSLAANALADETGAAVAAKLIQDIIVNPNGDSRFATGHRINRAALAGVEIVFVFYGSPDFNGKCSRWMGTSSV